MLVVDPWHWLDPDGSLPADGRLRRSVLRVARLIEYGGPLAALEGRETLVECEKRVRRARCRGLLWVVKTEDDEIHAFCGSCHADDTLISNWQTTPWADGPMPPLGLDPGADAPGEYGPN